MNKKQLRKKFDFNQNILLISYLLLFFLSFFILNNSLSEAEESLEYKLAVINKGVVT